MKYTLINFREKVDYRVHVEEAEHDVLNGEHPKHLRKTIEFNVEWKSSNSRHKWGELLKPGGLQKFLKK